jgi:hypothetical protein
MLEAYESYLLIGLLGFAAGVVVTRLVFRSSLQRRQIGEVIEYAMVEKTISQLESMTTILNRLVADIKTSAEELSEKIEFAQDMEPVTREPLKNRNRA